MSLHLGHYLGLSLIKEAVDSQGTQYTNSPLSEGSDEDLQRIREAFDSLPERNEMIPEDMDKVSAEAGFDTNSNVVENRPENDEDRKRGAPDKNDNAKSVDRVWRAHDGFEPQNDDNFVVDSVPEPGPAP